MSREAAAALALFSSGEGPGFSPENDPDSYGKLVMFSGAAAVEFSAGTQSLLNKGSELGRGGFGAVYRTVLGDGGPVAIKKLSAAASLIKSRDGFERKARRLGKEKKKSTLHFQSSFLKQHSDEEAVFSFRDINELIKDMLEIKGRYAAVETELKEIHNRYSELSLQFAEVEGERQKLMMTLKNVRARRNYRF